MKTNILIESVSDFKIKIFDISEYELLNPSSTYNVAYRDLFNSFIKINIYKPDGSVYVLSNTLSYNENINTTDSYWSFQEVDLKSKGMFIIEMINIPSVNQSFYNKDDCFVYNGFFYKCINDGSFLPYSGSIASLNSNFKQIQLEDIDSKYYCIKTFQIGIIDCMLESIKSLFCKVNNDFFNIKIKDSEEYKKASKLFVAYKNITESYSESMQKVNLKSALNTIKLINFLCCCCKC